LVTVVLLASATAKVRVSQNWLGVLTVPAKPLLKNDGPAALANACSEAVERSTVVVFDPVFPAATFDAADSVAVVSPAAVGEENELLQPAAPVLWLNPNSPAEVE
jgi:hypothetical protein